jgi:hypothetical protein
MNYMKNIWFKIGASEKVKNDSLSKAATSEKRLQPR